MRSSGPGYEDEKNQRPLQGKQLVARRGRETPPPCMYWEHVVIAKVLVNVVGAMGDKLAEEKVDGGARHAGHIVQIRDGVSKDGEGEIDYTTFMSGLK